MGKLVDGSISIGSALTVSVSMLSKVLGVLVNLAVIKLLQPEELGVFLGAQAIVFVGIGLCDLGLSQSYRLMVSRDTSLRTTLFGSGVLMTACALTLYLGFVVLYLVHKNLWNIEVALVVIGALVSQITILLSMDLMVNRKFRAAALLNISSLIGLMLGVLIAFFSSSKLFGLALGYSIGKLAWTLYAFCFFKRSDFTVKFSPMSLVYVRNSYPFFTSLLVTNCGLYFGIAYLLATEGPYLAGVFGLAFKLYQTVLLIPNSLTGVILPVLHKLDHDQEENRLQLVLSKLLGSLWAIIGCLVGVVYLGAEQIIMVVSSAEYQDSVVILKVLIIAALFKSLAIPAGNLVESKRKQWSRVAVQSFSTSIIVLSIFIVYPKYGILSIGIAMLVADICSFVLLWTLSFALTKRAVPWKFHIVGFLGLSFSLLITVALDTWWIAIAIFLILFLGTLNLFKIWFPVILFRQVVLGR